MPEWRQCTTFGKSVKTQRTELPNLAGDADPMTGYRVEVDGSNAVIGGTGAVAPLLAGLTALFNQALSSPVGHMNPDLYKKPAVSPGAFRDITGGNNGAYQARPGWDACTGWGSPMREAILRALTPSKST